MDSPFALVREGSINRRELAFKALAGLAGGAAGWLPVELVSYGHTLTQQPTPAQVVIGFIVWMILSGLIGGAIVAAERQKLEYSRELGLAFARGFVICFVLALPAYWIANAVFNSFLGAGGWSYNQPGSVVALIFGRIASWVLMGAMLGAGVGIATFTLANIGKGAIGGAIGGFLGGALFDPISMMITGGQGLESRFIGLSLIGLAIGLFIGLVQELTKTAWLTVEQGRLRGRQFRLDGPRATMGRAEENVVGLFGDARVQMRHAVIERKGPDYTIKSLAVQEGTLVNGRRVETVDLHDGDRISIGGYELGFHLRQTSAAARAQASLALDRPSPAHVEAQLAGPSAAVNGPCLVDMTGRRFGLRGDAPTRLGRALDNDLVVSHSSVSRHHASIEAHNGTLQVKDLNSQNGTFVDGKRVGNARLVNGDSIRFGDAQFTFRA